MTNDPQIGYGKPPKSTRFQKGQSGNPKGRPRNRHRSIPHDRVLGQMVTVVEDGVESKVTAAEAFLLHLIQQGISGNNSAARLSLDVLEHARALRAKINAKPTDTRVALAGPGVEPELGMLGIVLNKHMTDEARVRCEINPWIVEKALERLDWIGLSEEEQRIVWEATRTPHKVKWPDWWTYRPE